MTDAVEPSVTFPATVLYEVGALGLMAAASALLSFPDSDTAGMVTWPAEVPGAYWAGSPPNPSHRTTAVAPAFCAFSTLSSAVQSPAANGPLKTSAILPPNGLPPGVESHSIRSSGAGAPSGAATGLQPRASRLAPVRSADRAPAQSWATMGPPSGRVTPAARSPRASGRRTGRWMP